MPPLPDIDFAHIRPHGQPATRANAFEELASLLIRDDILHWPNGTRFDKFGNPDGGREGRGVLPSGEVWAWQAKYLRAFDSQAAAQVKKSFTRTMETEPELRRYYVTMPIDLPAGDNASSKSAFTTWCKTKATLEKMAAEQGRSVEVVFLGAHDLLEALTLQHNAGRVQYWFDREVLSQNSQEQRIDDVVAKVGRRYSPRLHVDVETAQFVDGAGRTPTYITRWREILAALRSARIHAWYAPTGDEDAFHDALDKCNSSLNEVDAHLERVIEQMQGFGTVQIPAAQIDDALRALKDVISLLRVHSQTKKGFYVDRAATLYEQVQTATNALETARRLCASPATAAACRGALLLTGRAGVGKTHLLCDASKRRISTGLPTVMILGQDFETATLITQVPELAELPGTIDDLLSLLNAAAEASGHKALLIIDAINESEQPERWERTIRAMTNKASRHSGVALVFSCRTEFVDNVVGEHNLPSAEHFGFQESTEVAVRRFASEYGLDVPSFPVFDPEFANPLFLRLACEAASTLGNGRLLLGEPGLTTICDAFVEAVNHRLSAPDRCDFDRHTYLVRKAIQRLAFINRGRAPRSDATEICGKLLPDRTWSKSLLKGMLDEGLLIEVGTDIISFGYQRIGDLVRAKNIAEKGPNAVSKWLDSLGHSVWTEHGVLGALSVLMPEQHGVELLDCRDRSTPIPYGLIDAFLESMSLRAPTATLNRTEEIVRELLNSDEYSNEMWWQLIRVACVPNHSLNARWLHRHLQSLDLPARDVSWSRSLIGTLDSDENSPIRTLIEWAWPPAYNDPACTNPNTAELAILVLGWCTSSTDRKVRDSATKALVALGERRLSAFASALPELMNSNDSYVQERVAAAACGIALRCNSQAPLLAAPLATWVDSGWPCHLLTRDYIRRVFETAKAHGWEGPDGKPPYGAVWPIHTTARTEIEQLAGPPDYKYRSIWRSLTGMGDFGRYIIEPALRDFVTEDGPALQANVEQAIFDRVRDLGWTPELFEKIDKHRRYDRSSPQVERFGKKYQRIGFYEVLGALADNLLLDNRWTSDDPHQYANAEELMWRDIDVTVLARMPKHDSNADSAPWFSPKKAEFPHGVVTEYPTDLAGVPDPLDLLAVTDPNGAQWLTLISHPDWKQTHTPEIAALRPYIRETWMHIESYLVPAEALDRWTAWADGKNWYGKWMPAPPSLTNVLLGAHPISPDWDSASGEIDDWSSSIGGEQPSALLHCGAWYGGTGNDRDASTPEETQGFVPSRKLFEILDLNPGIDFVWFDEQGNAVFDPAISLAGPNALLMRRDLVGKIRAAGYELFWTVLVGNELFSSDFVSPRDDHRWITASASYRIGENGIEMVHSLAGSFKVGPELVSEVTWSINPREI